MNASRLAVACLVATGLAACDSIPTAPAADGTAAALTGGLVLDSGNASIAQVHDMGLGVAEDASINSGTGGVIFGSGNSSAFTAAPSADRGGVIFGSGH